MRNLLTRSRLVAAVIFVISVALCAAAVQASDSGHDFQQIPGVVGRPVEVTGGTFRVDDVRVATSLTEHRAGGETRTIGTTPGMFVVASITIAATGSESLSFTRGTLTTRDRTYQSWNDTGVRAAAGFSTSFQAVWEVDPGDIDDLTAQFEPDFFITAYNKKPAVHLGITRANADQWRAAARDVTVSLDSQHRDAGLR